jgi:hypothetical protein
MNKEKKAVLEFEIMKDKAELNALSKISLERPLSDSEYEKMRMLSAKLYGIKMKKVS